MLFIGFLIDIVFVNSNAHTHTNTHTNKRAHTHAHTRAQKHTHAHTHTHTHTQTYTSDKIHTQDTHRIHRKNEHGAAAYRMQCIFMCTGAGSNEC